MKYNFNGKNINIPDKELQNLMKTLDLTEEEAIQVYLDDNDYTTNEEVEELTKKAKINNIGNYFCARCRMCAIRVPPPSF